MKAKDVGILNAARSLEKNIPYFGQLGGKLGKNCSDRRELV